MSTAWTATERSYIWLDSFPLDATEKNALIEEAGGVIPLVKNFSSFRNRFLQKGRRELFERMEETLHGGSYFKGLQALYERERITPVTKATEGYFSAWKDFPDAPCVLYVKGDVSLLKTSLFAVVGSRKIQESYQKIGRELCQGLASHFTLLTGAAEGGDEVAARGGLQGGKTVCMLAGGFGHTPQDGSEYLKEVEKKGAILSVCPYDTPVRNYSYERRNKLLAACAKGALILAAGEKSGAKTTAEYALKCELPLFVLPYAPNSPSGVGCNALIKKGGRLTENLIDILSYFGINLNKDEQSLSLTAEEGRVYEVLKREGESHLSALSQQLGVPVFKVAATLSKLEVKGLVVKAGGNKYLALS